LAQLRLHFVAEQRITQIDLSSTIRCLQLVAIVSKEVTYGLSMIT